MFASVAPAETLVDAPASAEWEGRLALNQAMERYADGRDDAFATVYDLLAPRLYGYALRQTRSAAMAEDVVQQTLLQIHCARARFLRGANVLPWAFAIARRLMIDLARRERCHAMLAPEGDVGRNPTADWSPEEALQGKELASRLERELLRVPTSHRAAFELVRQEGLTAAEAAEVLGTTAGAVKVRAHRVSAALRRAIATEP